MASQSWSQWGPWQAMASHTEVAGCHNAGYTGASTTMSSGYLLHLGRGLHRWNSVQRNLPVRTSIFWHIWHWVFWGSRQSMDWMVRVSTQGCANVFSFRNVDLNHTSQWHFTFHLSNDFKLTCWITKQIASQTTVVSHGAKSKSTFSSNSAKWLSSPHQWPAAQHLELPRTICVLHSQCCLVSTQHVRFSAKNWVFSDTVILRWRQLRTNSVNSWVWSPARIDVETVMKA